MIAERIYETAVRIAVPALRVAAPFSPRLKRSLAGRIESDHSLTAFERDATRPLLWLHAPSVGEALMAQAILAAVKQSLPGLQSAFTYFSPSAERIAPRVGADWYGYLPWDRRSDVSAALDALRPDCIAFVRTEIWPVLVREAAARGVPSLMVNGVLASDSSRLRGTARWLLESGYARLDAVGAVTAEDAANFPRLGVAPDRVHVTGDARFDQVVQRIRGRTANDELVHSFSAGERLWLVAGSTWQPDEDLLLPLLAARRERWRSVIAPHEPTAEHLTRLEHGLSAAGLRHVRLPADGMSAPVDPGADVVVVDRVGVLADLYAIADAAYVGGGFGSAGLHSVVEPAALGVPVFYGPRHGNAREAGRLEQAHGGFVVSGRDEAIRVLEKLEDEIYRRDSGMAARAFVEQHTGGAARGADLILAALRRTRGTASR